MAGWHHWCNGHEVGQTLEDGEEEGRPGMLQSMGSQRVGPKWVTEQQQHEDYIRYFTEIMAQSTAQKGKKKICASSQSPVTSR